MPMVQGPGSAKAFLSSSPISATVVEAAESRARRAALVAEAAQVIALVLADVAIARNVEAIRPAAGVADVEIAVDAGAGTARLVVIHDVVAQLARVVAEAIRKAARDRVQHDVRRAERRRAHENDLGEVVGLRAGVRIEHAHAGGPALVVVVDELVDDLVRQQRHVAGALGRGQRRRDAAEVAAVRTAADAQLRDWQVPRCGLSLCVSGAGEIGGAADDELATELVGEPLLEIDLDAVEIDAAAGICRQAVAPGPRRCR